MLAAVRAPHPVQILAAAAAAATVCVAAAGCASFDRAFPRHVLKVDLPDDIRYEVSQASDAQIAELTQCLDRFPSVVGIELSSPSGD